MAKGRERKTKSALGGSFTTLRFAFQKGDRRSGKRKILLQTHSSILPATTLSISHIPQSGRKKQAKKLFSRHFWHGGRGKEFSLPGFSKIYRTIPLTLKKEVQQRRVRKKRKLPLALPPSHFFCPLPPPIDIGSESVSSSFGRSVTLLTANQFGTRGRRSLYRNFFSAAPPPPFLFLPFEHASKSGTDGL